MTSAIQSCLCLLVIAAVSLGLVGDPADLASAGEAIGNVSGAAPAVGVPSILKRSHVAAWFDGPEDCLKYDVDLMIQDMDLVDELDLPKWKTQIDRLHGEGKLFFAELRPLTHLGKTFEYVMNDPGLQDAVCVDFNLNPIKVGWMADRSYKGRPVYFYCSNHPRYPRKGWCFGDTSRWYYPPQEDFEPLYDFVRTHRDLFDDYEAIEQVGVVFAKPSSNPASPLKRVWESLVNLNVPFGIVVAGDEWVPNRLSPDDVKRFELLLIPEPVTLDTAQRQVVEGWKSQKAAISISQQDDVGPRLAGRIAPLVSLESDSAVRFFPRTVPGRRGAPVVCHLVNWSYDGQANRALPQRDVKVRLRSAIAGDCHVTRVT